MISFLTERTEDTEKRIGFTDRYTPLFAYLRVLCGLCERPVPCFPP